MLAGLLWQPGKVSANLDQAIQDKLDELQQIEERLGEIDDAIKHTQQTYHETYQRLRQVEMELDLARSELARLQDQLGRTEEELEASQEQLVLLEDRLQERQGMLSRRIRVLYERGRVSYLEVLLGAQSFADFLSRYELLKSIVALDVDLMRGIRADRDAVAGHRQNVENRRNELVDLRNETLIRTAQVEQMVRDHEAAVEQLAHREQDLLGLYEQLEEDSQTVGVEIAQLQREAERLAGILRFRAPVWPVHVTSSYGMRWHPVFGGYRLHSGIDFAAHYGQHVFAAERGTVILARYYGGYGYTVIIDHGGGISSLYAHNSRLLVSEGEEVDRGELIALAGSTGVSTGPHVHFEIREYGEPQDPLEHLPDL